MRRTAPPQIEFPEIDDVLGLASTVRSNIEERISHLNVLPRDLHALLLIAQQNTRPHFTCTRATIAEALHVDQAVLTRAIRRLSKAGFVHEKVKSFDARRKQLSLSQKGKNALHAWLGARAAVMEDVFGSLSQRERRAFFRLVKRITTPADTSACME